MPRTYYTIDDLYSFCQENKFEYFSSKEHDNKPLIVQSIEMFEASDIGKDGLLPVSLKACHIGKNRNGSTITKENMEKCMKTFKGRPILGAIYKTDTGEYEFRAHDVEFVENGDEVEMEYIEETVGVISEIEEPYLKYDEEEDKTYLMVVGNVFEDYTRAADILKRRKTCKCSVEIAVNEMSWNGSEDALSIDDFSFRGVTILGYEQDGVTEIAEGMKGSKITIDSFSAEHNSMFSGNYQEKLLETLDKLNDTLSKFSINSTTKKGVEYENMNHFEELLEKYGKTVEDIDFEYENMTDEELDVKFEELFGGVETAVDSEAVADPETTSDPESTENPERTGDPESAPVVENSFEIKYELSHDDIRMGLYELLSARSESGYYCHWIAEVYDDKFIYQDCEECKYFRQGYSKDGENVSLNGEPVEVFNEWLSKDEKDALDALKKSYAELKEFKENYDAAQLKAAKDEIFNREEFAEIRESDAFKALVADAEKFSVAEVEAKAKTLFADHMIAQFAANKPKETKPTAMKFAVKSKDTANNKPYGNLFD